MTELPLLITHGLEIFWAGLGATAVIGGALLARRSARKQARAAAAEADAELGKKLTSALRVDEVVEVEGKLVSASADPLEILHEGDTLVLTGKTKVLAGTRDIYGWFMLPERRLVDGDRIVVRGVIRAIEEGEGGEGYRAAKGRRVVVGPVKDGERIAIASRERSRARVSVGSHVWFAIVAGALYFAVTWAAGRYGGGRAWDATHEKSADLARADRAIRWGSLGAATPSHRTWSLDAIGYSLSLSDVDDPDAHVDYALQSARYERYRTGECKSAIVWLQMKNADRATEAVGEDCGDASSLRAAAEARLRHVEIERASEDVERAARTTGRTKEQLLAEHRIQLLANKVGPAASALREISARIDEFYQTDGKPDLQIVFRCHADALEARSTAAARQRLADVVWDRNQPAGARTTCGLQLADTLEGAARLEVIDRLKAEPGLAMPRELQNLELEADPARAVPPRWSGMLSIPSSMLTASFLSMDATEWRALEALAAVREPTVAQRFLRMKMAGSLIAPAAQLGAETEAQAWYEMLVRDLDATRGEKEAWLPVEQERVAVMGAYLAMRDGKTPAPLTMPVGDAAIRRELDGLLRFRATGDLVQLREPGSYQPFLAYTSGTNDTVMGLETVSTASDEDLTKWLKDRFRPVALACLLVAAPRLQRRRDVILRWLAAPGRPSLAGSILDQIVTSAARANIATSLHADDVAKQYRSEAAELRRALFRRETALTIELTRAAR